MDPNPILKLFDRLDDWRDFPNYQLERRADIFFSMYLAEALEAKLGVAMRSELVPEMPDRIATISEYHETQRSKKIDYLAVSAAGDACVFVELKTDEASRNAPQDEYLRAAQDAGLAALLEGLLRIFCRSDAKRKYFVLMLQLERLGLLVLPDASREIMARPRLQGAEAACAGVRVTAPSARPHVVYVQPNGEGPGTISFAEFAAVVERHGDSMPQRFAASLRKWASRPAGHNDSRDG